MSEPGKLVFKECRTNDEITDIYNFNVQAFADMQDFDWSVKNIKNEIQGGWKLFSVEYEDDIVAVVFLKEDNKSLLTKNTPIKMEYQGNGFSHKIKDFYELYALNNAKSTIINYCPFDNFRMISLNERHNYKKTGNVFGVNDRILEWKKEI